MQIPCSLGAVRKWRSGERMPRAKQMRRIAEVTNGEVTANDFVSLEGTVAMHGAA